MLDLMGFDAVTSAARVARGASFNFVAGLALTALGLVYFALLARFLQPTDFGILTVLLFIYGLATLPGDLGLRFAAPKFLPELLSEGHFDEISGTLRLILKLTPLSAMTVSIVVLVLSPNLSELLIGSTRRTFEFQVLSFSIFAGTMVTVVVSFLQGAQRIGTYSVVGFVDSNVRRFAGLGFLAVGLGLSGVVLGWVLGDILGVFLAFFSVKQLIKKPNEKVATRPLLAFSLPMVGYSLLIYATDWVDRSFILAFKGLTDLGIYQIAILAFGVLGIVPSSIFVALFPQLSEIQQKGGLDALSSAFRMVFRYMMLFFTPLVFGAVVFARPIITIFAGPAYAAAILPFTIVSIGAFAFGFATVINSILLALGRTRLVFWITLASFGIFVSASYLLTPTGIVGAAVAKVLFYFALLALTIVGLKTVIKVSLDVDAFWKGLTAAALVALPIYTIQLLWYSIPIFFAYLILGGLAYIGILVALRAFNVGDFDLFTRLMPSRVRWIATLLRRLSKVDAAK